MTTDSSNNAVSVVLPLALDAPYTYLVRAEHDLRPGTYVRVPLGPRLLVGVVWETDVARPDGVKLRHVAEIVDIPPMPDHQRAFVDWIAGYYLSPLGMVLRATMRARAVFEPPRQKTAYIWQGETPDRKTPQRERVLAFMETAPAMLASDIASEAGVGTSVVQGLAKQGVLKPVKLPPFARFETPDASGNPVDLSDAQKTAAKQLRANVTSRAFSVTLIDGVTGAGKTEVYFEAMATAIARGKQVLLLLPEIALTPTFIARVTERFNAAPAEWHSQMRPRERERVWRAVASGEAKIVVGARSALYLPWKSPGLIVVDEEHDPAYKQGDGTTYHARDMAVVYGSIAKFAVILASATPSLESLVNVDRGRYQRVSLPNRHGRARLPELTLIDLRAEAPDSGKWISPPLAEAVDDTLKRDEQALLFLNRRGYAPLTLCRTCGFRIHCKNCSSWLVEHRFRRQLICHHCGYTEPVPDTCPSCSTPDSLVPCGPGVERLAEEAAERFPDAAIVTLSSDVSRAGGLQERLDGIARGDYNLIIGTQLVAKGHHFPDLTLAGIIDADLALETSDPRAGERTWQLLSQVSGRAGRADKPGRALIQSYMPEHPLLQALAKGDRDGFLAEEKSIRKAAGLPPFGQLAGLVISGKDLNETEHFARHLATLAPRVADIAVLGPAVAPLAQIRGRFRFRFLIKTDRSHDIQAFCHLWLQNAQPRGSIRLSLDIDPYNFL